MPEKVPILLENGQAQVVLELGTCGSACVDYRWKYWDTNTASGHSGSGRVFEDFTFISIPFTNSRLAIRDKSVTTIKAGPIRLKWSANTWLYYPRSEITLRLLEGQWFDRVHLPLTVVDVSAAQTGTFFLQGIKRPQHGERAA